MQEFVTGMPENEEEKTLCCFVLDSSGSMMGSAIHELNEGIKLFYKQILRDKDSRLRNQLEIAIIEFSNSSTQIREPGLLADDEKPLELIASGGTALNQACRQAIKIVGERKQYYAENEIDYKRPWIILMTDGAPTDGDVASLAKEIEDDTMLKKYVFQPVAVDGANPEILKKLEGCLPVTDNEGNVIEVKRKKTIELKHADFAEFFEFLSKSFEGVVGAQAGDNKKDGDPWDILTTTQAVKNNLRVF